MTEYDFSPEAYDRYLATQARIAKWVDNTELHRTEFQAPFGPGGVQQQQPTTESVSSGTPPIPPRHRDGEEHHSKRHHGDPDALDSSSLHAHEHQSVQDHTSRSHPPVVGHTHHHHHRQHHQHHQTTRLEQQYASPHVQIYGAPGNVHHSHQPMHASYSYAGANSPPHGYPSYAAPDSPPLYSGESSHKNSKKSKRSHSHQPDAAAAAAAIAAYYGGAGYVYPPAPHGYHQHAYPSPPASGGRSGKGGYFVVEQSYFQSGSGQVTQAQVIQGQYPPVVPVMYRTR